ncbi:2Fe-2S iron-sulfur cluster binding domain-containing protein [Colwellia piezophila]|uniref:2Fe-2S iron-sulfur cluster binding domain-containing protein n=1 Tax=Colwellia piezophila TaxID=211668 RepID=UPI00036B4A74|nr:2Fe-2S iron-sulfur cluster binding domain-containing protein [Colwellia piezophila]
MPWIRKIHKWASLIVGIQFLLWLLSGIFFNLMDHTEAAGHTFRSHAHQHVEVNNNEFVELKDLAANFKASISIAPTYLLGQAYYLLTHEKGLYKGFKNHYTLVDAYTGEQVVIDSVFAAKLAKQSYNGPSEISSVELMQVPIEDFPKQKNASWRINFVNDIDTSVYIEAESGRLVGHSDDHKRFADFFFMLHFMDYGNEGSFNNIQMILFAFITLWLSLTGLIWTIDLGLRGQYKIKFFAKQQGVKLFDKNQKSMGTIKLSSHTNLLDGLIEHDIALPSTCGGGGTCGRCKVMINPIVKTTSADYLHFTDDELQQGYRLACQHFSNDIENMTLIDVTDAKKHTLVLSESSFVSPYMKELRFKVIGESSLSYKAGAFMRFFIPAAKGVSIPLNLPENLKPHWHHIEHLEYEHLGCTRSYSLAESSMNTNELVFTIKIQTAPHQKVIPGVGSSYLCNLPIGETISAIGPFEEFFASKNSNKTMVMLGAGSGMAPLKSLIEEQMTLSKQTTNGVDTNAAHIHFFYGARAESDLLYAEQFYQLAVNNEHFHYYPTLSQGNDDWLGATGYAQQILALNLDNLGDIDNIEFYLCGPKSMMTETMKLLTAKGVKENAIAFDDFS